MLKHSISWKELKMLSVLVQVFIFTVVLGRELPPFLQVCHQNEPNMEACLINAIEKIRPYLVTGVPEYNIPSIEPLVLENLIDDKAAGLHITTTDVKTYGCSNFTIEDMTIFKDEERYEFNIFLPNLRIDAHYQIDGKLLLVPMKGEGAFRGNVSDCKSKTVLQADIYEKEGKRLVRYLWQTLSINVGGGHVHLDNLFGGDNILSDAINETINKNLALFLKELLPVIEKALAGKFLDIANKIVEPFTYDQLFPE